MEVRLVSARELDAEHVADWTRLQEGHSQFSSPFFRPEFVRCVASVYDDIEVAVMRRDDKAVGFFPFQRASKHVAMPVGEVLSDFHGVVIQDGEAFEPHELLRQCGLRAWHFNHLLVSQPEFKSHHWIVADSPYMDLSQGFEAYRAQKKAERSRIVRDIPKKMRKIEREIGPLRLEFHSTDAHLFGKLVDWKRQRYARIQAVDYLRDERRVAVLAELIKTQTEGFRGTLSALYAGDHLIALHLGMLSRGLLHCYFPTYNEDFAKYSPGLIFWFFLAQQSDRLGIQRLDFGKGPARFKRSLKTGDVKVAEGSVDTRPVARSIRRSWLGTREWVRSSPLGRPAQHVVRSMRSWTQHRE